MRHAEKLHRPPARGPAPRAIESLPEARKICQRQGRQPAKTGSPSRRGGQSKSQRICHHSCLCHCRARSLSIGKAVAGTQRICYWLRCAEKYACACRACEQHGCHCAREEGRVIKLPGHISHFSRAACTSAQSPHAWPCRWPLHHAKSHFCAISLFLQLVHYLPLAYICQHLNYVLIVCKPMSMHCFGRSRMPSMHSSAFTCCQPAPLHRLLVDALSAICVSPVTTPCVTLRPGSYLSLKHQVKLARCETAHAQAPSLCIHPCLALPCGLSVKLSCCSFVVPGSSLQALLQHCHHVSLASALRAEHGGCRTWRRCHARSYSQCRAAADSHLRCLWCHFSTGTVFCSAGSYHRCLIEVAVLSTCFSVRVGICVFLCV